MGRQKGLGRGLGALIPGDGVESEGAATAGIAVYRELPVGAISVNRNQPRAHFEEGSLSALTASIREVGVLQPILVRATDLENFELIAGERRWRAAKRAGLKTVPAIVRSIEDLTSLEHALVENLHREDLGPLEEAAAYQQLLDDFSLTQDAVAQRVGKSRSAVANSLRLLQLPAGVQGLLAEGAITAGHARALLGLASRQEQDIVAHQIVAEDLTVRQVEQLIRSSSVRERDHASVAKPVANKPAALLEVQELLTDALETRVLVSMGQQRGKIAIEFADMADLQRIYRLLT